MISASLCLALNVYYEARGEIPAGQDAVAMVTLNRAAHQPARVCQVVMARHQFSWTAHHGLVAPGLPGAAARLAWARAQQVASAALSGRIVDATGGATSFHEQGVAPGWRQTMVPTCAIGRHVFYKPRVAPSIDAASSQQEPS